MLRLMNTRLLALAVLPCALALASCRKNPEGDKPISGPLQAGALYSFNDGEGGFRAGKVVAVEEEVTFVQLFSDRWTKRPSLAEARKAGTPISLAYTAQTITGMQPVLLESGTVTGDELETFEAWRQSKREVF